MSGFLPDLASWALRGGAGTDRESQGNANNTGGGQQQSNNTGEAPLTAEEMRLQRLARIEAVQQQQKHGEQEQVDAANKAEPMDIDSPSAPVTKEPLTTTNRNHEPTRITEVPILPTVDQPKKTVTKPEASATETTRRAQRKKELLIKKVLAIALAGTSTSSDSSCVVIDLDTTEISTRTTAEILAARLSIDEATCNKTVPTQKPLMAYLAQCHRRAAEELKTLQQSYKKPQNNETLEILDEIQRQVVSYAASCLIEPGLFEIAKDAPVQLAKCLIAGVADLSSSITFGVSGSSSSFYYLLCEELIQQDESALDATVAGMVDYISKQLVSIESVLDANADGSSVVLVSALSALCSHKRSASALTNLPTFLLPAAGTAEASQQIRPAGSGFLQILTGENRPYLRRSGPALEKHTILGMALRVGVPKTNASFSPTSILRQSLDSVERTSTQQRGYLRMHQDACHQLVMALIKAGPVVRAKVMHWVMDALLVNVHASAMRPDPTKVSSSNMLLNMSIVLLKLCDPFVNDEKKHHLIDAGFVSSENDHMGVFATSGDSAVARLGENTGAMAVTAPYTPRNGFIPQCFFLCARSLHYSVAPLLSYHESLLRHISYTHYEISNSNRDLHSDPHFAMLVSKQRSNEVALFQEDLVTDTLRFCNLMAKLLFEMDDSTLTRMPEDFVSDLCDIIMQIAKLKPKMLRGIEFRYVFKLSVKLLSEQHAGMVRNYNLRARLGDVLYELFLPSSSVDKRDVPSSVAADAQAGGQAYLLSDPKAQNTLAPSLLLLYGEVEHTGYYDKMSHRAKIMSIIKFLWESSEHRPAFRRITQNKESFVKFANGIINETNTLIATVMQKLPEIRSAQEQMKNAQEWGRLSEDQQTQITSRLGDSEREVRHALPLCNKTLQMFGYLSTDPDIRSLFLLEELCPRLVGMLLHVLTKLVGSRGLELKVDNPDQYEFRPKEMLRDLCAIFSLFAVSEIFQLECARAGCDPNLLRSAVKTCRRLNLLTGVSMTAFDSLPNLVEDAVKRVADDDALYTDAPEEFLDEILSSYMKDPVILPSGHFVDRATITQHLLNDPIDPFNREPMTMDDVKPATELKERMNAWLEEKRRGA